MQIRRKPTAALAVGGRASTERANPLETLDMLIGIISKIISEKRIGFIKPYAPGGDVFFHFSVVAGVPAEQLQEGQAVGFEFDKIEGTRARPRASKVEPCDKKLLGATSAAEVAPVAHPRARHRKPTWRR